MAVLASETIGFRTLVPVNAALSDSCLAVGNGGRLRISSVLAKTKKNVNLINFFETMLRRLFGHPKI